MKSYYIVVTIIAFIAHSTLVQSQRNAHYITNQEPLVAQPYTPLPLGTIKAKGWLLKMLETQRDGLTGQLDEVYEVVAGSNNGWLGGTGDSWERGPYWIDGLTPLAYLLDDEDLKFKAKKWIDWSIENQRENGYFGPIPNEEGAPKIEGTLQSLSEDWWPKMVMLKVFQQYYTATEDKRILKLMDAYFKYQLKELPNNPLDAYTYWAGRRGGDNLQVVYWLYNITKEPYLLELGTLIHKQTYNWTNVFVDGTLTAANPHASLHCVNVAQAIKEPAIYYQHSKDTTHLEAPKKGLESLKRVHGFANGMYGGDEDLHGNDPTQGSELCSAVELMYSLESILPITGNTYYADYLEKIAFNVLPAQHDDDFMTKQYFQQPNQIKITHEYRNFYCSYDGSSTLFGTLTGYPCCVSNMHQGWPKFTQNLYYATATNGIAALAYAPSSVDVKVSQGINVHIDEETNYPFDDKITFTLDPEQDVDFEFELRVPSWCDKPSVLVNGKQLDITPKDNIIKLKRRWAKDDIVVLNLPMKIKTSRWFEQSVAIERGPLLYALRIKENWKKIKKDDWKDPFYEVYPASPWNYGISKKTIDTHDFTTEFKTQISGNPWNQVNAPISLFTKAKVIPYWGEYNGSTGKLPISTWPPREISTKEEIIELIPYGCTALRISQFPVIEIHN